MINGMSAIVAKMTQGDEFGVYREYHQAIDNKQQFLLFTCTERDEAIRFGGGVAAALRVRFRNELPEIEKRADDAGDSSSPVESPAAPARPRRVTGIGPKIRAFIREGATDQQIENELLDLYLAAGHTPDSGRNLLLPYIKEIRKGG